MTPKKQATVMQTYIVKVERIMTDYVPVTATSKEEALELMAVMTSHVDSLAGVDTDNDESTIVIDMVEQNEDGDSNREFAISEGAEVEQ